MIMSSLIDYCYRLSLSVVVLVVVVVVVVVSSSLSLSCTPSPLTKSFPTKSPRVELSGRPPIKYDGHENSHPLELRVCLSQTL